MALNKTQICFEQIKVRLPQENASLVFTTFHNIQYVQRVCLASETYFDIIKFPLWQF